MVPFVLDHLWQSTLLALALGLATLAFRRASAGVRHGLWFAASAKFLIPFAALAALGRLAGPAIPLPAEARPEAALIERAAQPFSQAVLPRTMPADVPVFHRADLQAPLSPAPSAAPLAHPDPVVATVRAAPRFDLGLILLAVWALGSAAILGLWARRWARLRQVVRSARPAGWPAPMPVLAAPSLVEPGLVGLWRPVLLVPETLPGALPRSGVDAIVAHEAAHLRRRDNLTAAVHMLVEALFWFHPLVWWIGGRLIAEREAACDEAVLAAGHDRAIYARSLVESCRLYLQSPLDCVAGASGSDLKSRVEAIMTARPASPLSRSAKALLLAAGACAFATPVMAGLLTTPEGQTVVARAAAVASRVAAVRLGPVDRVAAGVLSATEEGRPTAAVLAQTESVRDPARLDAAAGPPAQDAAASGADQAEGPATARPGTEDAVRHWIVSLQTHQPDPDLSPALEQSPRPQIGVAQEMFRSFGGLKAIRFVSVTPEGDDAFEADFTHAKIQVLVGPLEGGKLTRLAWGPLWTDPGAPRTDPAKPLPPVTGMQAPLYRWGGPAPQSVTATAPPAPPLSLTPVAAAPAPGVTTPQVAAFVQSYGEAFWNQDKWICVRVEGLPSDKAAAVKARVEADARAVGVSVGRAECGLRNEVEIRFAADAGRAVEGVLDYYHHPFWPFPLERPTGADRPIKAWYGMVYDFAGGAGGRGLGAHPNARQKLALAIVVVDPARSQGLSLDTVSDYAAMLALSQPRSLDRCNVLPSITDLYAGACPGRPAPTGLMAADTAFLTALYRGSPGIRATRSPAELVEGVAKRLGGAGAVQPAVAPAAAPRLRLTPISMTTRPAGPRPEVSAFVQSFANTLWNQDAICIRAEGDEPGRAAQVQARVEADARAAGVSVTRNACETYQVEIRFAPDAARAVHDVLADRKLPRSWPYPIQAPSGAGSPIRAWYEVVDDLAHANHPSQWAPGAQTGMEPQIVEAAPYGHKKLGLAIVVVDPARTRDLSPDAIADYVTMLALSQPRSLDRCSVLPSVTDLYAGACAGRPAPTGLTAADVAYLEALYAGNPELRAARYRSDLVDAMAKRLGGFGVAVR